MGKLCFYDIYCRLRHLNGNSNWPFIGKCSNQLLYFIFASMHTIFFCFNGKYRIVNPFVLKIAIAKFTKFAKCFISTNSTDSCSVQLRRKIYLCIFISTCLFLSFEQNLIFGQNANKRNNGSLTVSISIHSTLYLNFFFIGNFISRKILSAKNVN